MKILSKPEELVLLAVLKLEDKAYGVPIRNLLIRETGMDWSIGAVYVPLGRLAKDGYLDAQVGEPTAERGGKRKKFYRLTSRGIKVLAFTQKVNETMWSNLPSLEGEGL
ncbi:PadR family transcriptional regulator [Acidobacteriota bacterium]